MPLNPWPAPIESWESRRIRGGNDYRHVISNILLSVGVTFVALWLILIAGLLWLKPDRQLMAEAARLPYDVMRLVRTLLADAELPRGVRARLWLLLGYLVTPIDLVVVAD